MTMNTAVISKFISVSFILLLGYSVAYAQLDVSELSKQFSEAKTVQEKSAIAAKHVKIVDKLLADKNVSKEAKVEAVVEVVRLRYSIDLFDTLVSPSMSKFYSENKAMFEEYMVKKRTLVSVEQAKKYDKFVEIFYSKMEDSTIDSKGN